MFILLSVLLWWCIGLLFIALRAHEAYELPGDLWPKSKVLACLSAAAIGATAFVWPVVIVAIAYRAIRKRGANRGDN